VIRLHITERLAERIRADLERSADGLVCADIERVSAQGVCQSIAGGLIVPLAGWRFGFVARR
jgi:hypothetical protein